MEKENQLEEREIHCDHQLPSPISSLSNRAMVIKKPEINVKPLAVISGGKVNSYMNETLLISIEVKDTGQQLVAGSKQKGSVRPLHEMVTHQIEQNSARESKVDNKVDDGNEDAYMR